METLDRLKAKLGLDVIDTTTETLLKEYLDEASTAIKNYLDLDYESVLDSRFVSSQISLAFTYYNRDMAKNIKSESYSEGVVSQSVISVSTEKSSDNPSAIAGTANNILQQHTKNNRLIILFIFSFM